jgi:hypothetical protein
MNWYYVDAGQQAGPVDDAQLQELLGSGKIQQETLVWHEGMTSWLPYREAARGPLRMGTAPEPASVAENQAVCVECGRTFDKQQMISYRGAKVCAGCKPVFMQKLAEGVPVRYAHGKRALPVNADELIAEVLARDYQVDTGSCIKRAWSLVSSNLGLTVGGTVLVMLCIQAGGFIPLLGIIIAMILQGPLMGGLNVLFLKLIRGKPATIGDAFCGFSKRFWPLCGTFVLMALLIYAWFIPPVVAALFAGVGRGAAGSGFAPGLAFWGLVALAFLGVFWLAICFVFALPLSADLELGPVDALRTSFRVVSRHWFAVFGLTFLAGFLSMLGLAACIVGVFLTLPIFYAATLYAYEDIFGVRSGSSQ